MGQTARQDRHVKVHSEPKRLDAPGFKPLALPALAAAVLASRRSRGHAAERDRPPILREDPPIG